jgi:hypothetical protein
MVKYNLLIITVAVVALLATIFIRRFKAENFYYSTPYPAQCPAMGLNFEAPSPDAPFVRTDEQTQLQLGRCSGDAPVPFFANVFTRDIYPATPENRFKLTGALEPETEPMQTVMETPLPKLVESPLLTAKAVPQSEDSDPIYRGAYGDVILKDYLSLYSTVSGDDYSGIYK